MSNNRWCALALLVLWVGSGCDRSELAESGSSKPAGPGGTLVLDEASELEAELEQADLRFARDVRERGLEGWVGGFAVDGSVLPAQGPIVSGPEAIRALFEPVFADPAFEFRWEPVKVAVSPPGNLGYTFGTWQSVSTVEGRPVRSKGKYATVWRRGEDGIWRVVLDIGNRSLSAGASADSSHPE